jgi:hypothetical protein
MVRASQLARADDAGDARRDLLWPELAANLLPRRSAGVAGHMVLFDISDGLAMQIAVSLVGIAAMIATATLLNLDQHQAQAARIPIKARFRCCASRSQQ